MKKMEEKTDQEFTKVLLQIKPNNLSKSRIIKNVFILSTGFVIFFTAYDALSMLQSTINREQGIGVASQAVLYACFSVSALLLPKYVIQKLGCKITLVMSMLLYVPYLASNYYPHWATMIPSAAVLGLSASLLWGSQCTYLNEISSEYAKLSSNNCIKNGSSCIPAKENYSSIENCSKQEKRHQGSEIIIKPAKIDQSKTQSSICRETGLDKMVESTNASFFGIFGMAYLSTHAISNMMSYFVLQKSNIYQGNSSNLTCDCGPNFCNADSDCFNHNVDDLSNSARYILTSICVALSLFSIILIVLFLDNIKDDKKTITFSLDLLMATCKLTKNKELIFLIPLSFYVGMIQGFYTGDFTKSYIGCAWGTNEVGLVSICYGAACAISSTLSGYLVNAIGRIPTFLIAELINVAANVLLLMWEPNSDITWVFFLAAAMWGTFTGTFYSQLRAFYGILFKKDEEAAFAGFYLWYSLGFCLSFAYSNYLCTYTKIYVLISVSTIGMIGYISTEIFRKINKTAK